jgi:hypothetical protein
MLEKTALKMKINLNNNFYAREAIEEAVSAFSEVCDCRILDDSFAIEIRSGSGDELTIAGEFCNFVLGITKENL